MGAGRQYRALARMGELTVIKDIETIKETGLVTDGAAQVLMDLAHELEENFAKVQVHRTRTEMEVSVLNDLKFPTPSSKYWQAVREQNGMMSGVTMLAFDYRETQVKADLLLRKLTAAKDGLKRRLYRVRWERQQYLLKEMKRAAKAKIREIKDWSEIKARESQDMTEDELRDVGNHQLISYTKRWVNQIVEGGLNGSPAENQNLVGQLKSGLKVCIDRGMRSAVMGHYPPEVRERVMGLLKET